VKALVLAICLFAMGIATGMGCAAKEWEADAAYGGQQELLCIAPEPILGPNATTAERAAAWARVDACRAKIQSRWGVIQTSTEAGHD